MHIVPASAVSFPFGSASAGRGDTLGARYSTQWMPFELGLGAKIIDELYIGAYLNVGLGWEGSDIKTEGRCEAGNDIQDDVSCSTTSVHAGIEARYSITPAEWMSGWVGYGLGITSATQSISDAGRYDETSTAQGLEFARLSGGLDFRFTRGFGMGPFALVQLGRYTHERTTIRNVTTFSGDIDNPAAHAWVSVGVRLVILP